MASINRANSLSVRDVDIHAKGFLAILDVCIAHVIGCLQLACDCSDVLVMALIDLYRLPEPPPVQVHDR